MNTQKNIFEFCRLCRPCRPFEAGVGFAELRQLDDRYLLSVMSWVANIQIRTAILSTHPLTNDVVT